MSRTEHKQKAPGAGRDLGPELLQSVRAKTKGAKRRVHRPKLLDVTRARLPPSFPRRTSRSCSGSRYPPQDWEQGRREPSAAPRTMIKVAERHPEVLRELAT